ncbi:MAG: hypothetical protein LBT05_15330 [Planctomycetaceae bacterium]|jgi:hypothetical protein|nr:hypothetical protein [Planctomycetaceae bacterium]
MKSGWFNTVVGAVVGGVVGAVVAFVCLNTFHPTTASLPEVIDKLKVKELVVSERMFLWNDGKEDADLRIENGVIVARNRIFASEICGKALVGQCVLTTPDDLVKTRLENCTVYTEMASSSNEGGLLTIRSPNGGHLLSAPNGVVNTGYAYTVAYNPQGEPNVFVRQNNTNSIAAITPFVPPQRRPDAPGTSPNGNASSVPPTDASSANVPPLNSAPLVTPTTPSADPNSSNQTTARGPGNLVH